MSVGYFSHVPDDTSVRGAAYRTLLVQGRPVALYSKYSRFRRPYFWSAAYEQKVTVARPPVSSSITCTLLYQSPRRDDFLLTVTTPVFSKRLRAKFGTQRVRHAGVVGIDVQREEIRDLIPYAKAGSFHLLRQGERSHYTYAISVGGTRTRISGKVQRAPHLPFRGFDVGIELHGR